MEIKQQWRHPRIDSSEPGVRERKHRLIAATFRKQQQKRGVKRGKKPRTRPPGSHPQDTRRLKEKDQAATYSDEPVPLGPLEVTRSVFRLCVGRDLRYGGWRARGRGASRTERKLWLASFHQDATIARSNAAILLRSVRASVQ